MGKNVKKRTSGKKKKAFTMVEVLAIIVVLAILTSISIPIISNYLDNSKDIYNKKLEKQLLIAGKDYYSANQKQLPKLNYIDKKFAGETKSEVLATQLLSKNFLKNDLIDADGFNCNESYVMVAKNASEKEYMWHSCLICETEKGKVVRTENDPYCTFDVNWDDKEKPTCKIEVQTTEEYKNEENIYNPENISLKFTALNDLPSSDDPDRKNYSYLSIYNQTTGKTIHKNIADLGETRIKDEINLIDYLKGVEGKITVSIIDKGFNKSNACISDLTLDKTPPTCEIEQGKIVKIDSGLEKTDLEITAKDKIGIRENSYTWKDDDKATNPRSVYINNKYEASVKDLAGNVGECDKEVTDLKTKAATVEITATKKDSKKQVETNTWSDEGLNYTFKRTDDLKLEAKITYCQDLTNECNPKTSTLTTPKDTEITTYNNLTGEYYIRYVASIEIEGKTIYSNVKSYKAKVDTVTPSVTLSATKKTSGKVAEENKWSTEGLNFTLTQGTVGVSGATIYYCKDTKNTCTPNQIGISGKLITSFNTTEGTFYIRYRIESKSGKKSAVQSYTAKVDTVRPTVTISATKKTSGTKVSSDRWSNQGLNFKLTKDTTGSSGYTIYYCKDTANTCNPTTTVSSGTQITKFNTLTGTFYIRYKIVGGSGLSSSVGSYTAKVDTITPTVTISATKATAGTSVSSGKWSNQGLNFKLTKDTTGSSGYTIYYCKDTANTCNPTTTVSSGTQITKFNTLTGTFYIRYKIVGGSGNSSSVKSYTAKIDKVTPTVTISATKKTAGTKVSSGTWSNQGLNFKLTKGTTGSSGYTIYYCKDTKNTCSPGTTATSGTAITGYNGTTGTFYIRYKIVGGSGNSSSVGSYTAKVDTAKPTITYSVNHSIQDSSWYKTSSSDPFKVTIKCTDGGSGVDKFTINGTSYTSTTKTLSMTSAANPKSYASKCTDNAGNEASKTNNYKIKVYGTNSSCSCKTYYRCKAAGCESYSSCPHSDCGCKTYNYSFGSWKEKIGATYPGTGVSTCNANNVGEWNRQYIMSTCTKWGSNGRYCLEPGHKWKYRKCNKGSCKTYKTCTTSGCGCAQYKRSSACNCETRNSCWHF